MRYMLGVRVRLRNVLTVAIKRFKATLTCQIQHIGDAQTWLARKWSAPCTFKQATSSSIRYVAIPCKFMWHRTHITRTLHIVLSTQWVNAHAFTPKIACCHGKISDTHDHG